MTKKKPSGISPSCRLTEGKAIIKTDNDMTFMNNQARFLIVFIFTFSILLNLIIQDMKKRVFNLFRDY